MRLSVSAIGCYLSCGLKYKFVYIDKLPAQIEIPAMKKGSDIHSLFENYSKSFPPVEVTEELIEEHKKVIPVTEYQKYKEHIDNFIDLNKYILHSIPSEKFFRPIAVEEDILDEGWQFKGIIDAVYFDGKNVLVLDFKTGKPSEDLGNWDYRFQLSCYVEIWNRKYPSMKVTHWGHFYSSAPLSNKNPLIEKVSENEMMKMLVKVENVRRQIMEGKFEKTKNTFFCGRCEYLPYCLGCL